MKTDKGEEPLSLREACNKIIHAQGLLCDLAMGERNPIWDKFYKSQNEDVVGTYKTPAIIIRGEKHNKKWEARLEIVPFIYGVSVPGISQWNLA